MGQETALNILWNSCMHNEETKEAYNVLKNNTRQQGRWVFKSSGLGYGYMKCNQCDFSNFRKVNYNFCPHCGADMRGGAE